LDLKEFAIVVVASDIIQ